MKTFGALVVTTICCAALIGADWPTDGGNPQRTNWQKDETILNKNNVANLKVLWKLKLDNVPRQMHSLFPPLIIGRVPTPNGVRQIALTAGSSDKSNATLICR